MLKIHVLDSLLGEGSCLITPDLKLSPCQNMSVRLFYAQKGNLAHAFLSFNVSFITH